MMKGWSRVSRSATHTSVRRWLHRRVPWGDPHERRSSGYENERAAGHSRLVDREGRIGWPSSDDLLWGSRLPADGWVMREIRFPDDTVVDECRLSLVLVIPHA